MKKILVIPLMIVGLLITNISHAEIMSVNDVKFEEGEAPEESWKLTGITPEWQRISIGNISFTGNFSDNDSVDVFALEIVSEKLTRVGFSIRDSNFSAGISIQRLNQSSWSIEDFSTVENVCENDTNWSCGEIELGNGLHAIRLERLGDFENSFEYNFKLRNLGEYDDDSGVFVNLAWKFTPFYIFAGIFLILPLVVVLWWNKEDLFGKVGKNSEIMEYERKSLISLKERFTDDDRNFERNEIKSFLKILGERSWEATRKEFGSPEIRHHTKDLEICAWRFGSSSKTIILGLKTMLIDCEMSAVRIFSPLGQPASIEMVDPEYIFNDDEIFIGKIISETTIFLRVKLKSSHSNLNIHFSGLVEGNPVAASPTNSISNEDE
ncbi:MAG: hypothetical protein CMA12_01510 [Euryarchaeota archaeon]|nr:hypothetical protein [Euryarchaeota archaeon]OUW22917.1 MAG: hypothetical protein CBD33_00085 [Euryarchaeota archaeon TMED173]